MDGLTFSRIRRLISNRKRAVRNKFWLKQRKFYEGNGQWNGCEKAACLAVGNRSEQKEAYNMAESAKGMKAVLSVGNKEQRILNGPGYFPESGWKRAGQRVLRMAESSRLFIGAFVSIEGRRLLYFSSGGYKVAVWRNNKLFLMPENTNVCDGKEERGQVFLTPGDFVMLMNPVLYDRISWKVMEGCMNQKGSCEEKALRLVNMACQEPEKESLGSAVVVIQL